MRFLAISLGLGAIIAPAHADTRTMSVGKFNSVSVSSMIDVELRQGPQSVTVEQDRNDFSDLKLEVRNGTLHIGRMANRTERDSPLYRVIVTAPALDAISAASASDVEGRGLWFKKLSVSVASAASVSLEGACREIALAVSTSGDFSGGKMRCETGKAEATTSGMATLWISGAASAKATTGARLVFAGKPKSVASEATLGGSIKVK